MGEESLANDIKVSREEARRLMQLHSDAYPRVQEYLRSLANFGETYRFITTPCGRVRHFPHGYVNGSIMGSIKRESKNTPIQGCNAEIIKIAQYDLYKELIPYRGQIALTNIIHDEFNGECDLGMEEFAAGLFKRVMEEAGGKVLKKCPVIVEVMYGQNWGIKS